MNGMDPFSAVGLAAFKGAAGAGAGSLVRSLLPRLTDPWTLLRFRREFSAQLSEVRILGAQRAHLERLFQDDPFIGRLSLLKTPQEVHAMVSGQMIGYLPSERILVTKAMFTAINIVIQVSAGDRLTAGMVLDLYLSQSWPAYRDLLHVERRRLERPGVDAVQELSKILSAAGQQGAQLQVSEEGGLDLAGPVKMNMTLSDPHALEMQQWLQGGSLGTLVLRPEQGQTRLTLGSEALDALMGMNINPDHQVLIMAAQPEEREVKVEIRVADDNVRITKCTVVADRAERVMTFTFGDPDLFALVLRIGETYGKVGFHVNLGTRPLPISYRGLLRDLLKLCEPGVRLLVPGRSEPIISHHELWGEDGEVREAVQRAATYHLMFLDILERAQNDGQDIDQVQLPEELDEVGVSALMAVARAVRKEGGTYTVPVWLTADQLTLIERRDLVALGVEVKNSLGFEAFAVEARGDLHNLRFEPGETDEDGRTLVHISGDSGMLSITYTLPVV